MDFSTIISIGIGIASLIITVYISKYKWKLIDEKISESNMKSDAEIIFNILA